jgi:hypothetical protein
MTHPGKKIHLIMRITAFSLFAAFCFLTCQLFISHAENVRLKSKQKIQCSINSNNHAEFPSSDDQSKVTVSPSHLLLNAPINVTQEVFLIFEIHYTQRSICERVITASVPLSKFLNVVLGEIISPNAP